MIAPETITLTSNQDRFTPIHLSPFEDAELRQIFPLDPEAIAHETTQYREMACDENIEHVAAHMRQNPHQRHWGIYIGARAARNIVGTIELSQQYDDRDNTYTETSVEVGTTIAAPEQRGKGYGTLAKLAVAQFAFEHRSTYVVMAWASASNLISQRSLYKTGFTRLGSSDHMDFPDGSLAQDWILARPEVMGVMADDEASLAQLQEGWQRYRQALADTTLTVTI